MSNGGGNRYSLYHNESDSKFYFDQKVQDDGRGFFFRTHPSGGSSGTVAMSILGSGNVGIGTTSPAHKFDVETGSGIGLFVDSYVSDVNLGTYGSKDLYLSGNNNVQILSHLVPSSDSSKTLGNSGRYWSATYTDTLYTTGNVGIGTTSPSYLLTVQDGEVAVGNGATKGYIFHDFGTGWGYKGVTSPSRLGIFTDAYERVTILAGGKVGIGTTSPGYPLDVNGVARFRSITRHAAGSAAWPSITYHSDVDTGIWFPGNGTVAISTNSTEAFRVDSSQDATFAGDITVKDVSAAITLMESGDNAYYTTLSSYHNAGDTFALYGIKGDYLKHIRTDDADEDTHTLRIGGAMKRVDIWSNGSQRLLINEDGNVGIGTTGPTEALSVSGSINVFGEHGHITASGNIKLENSSPFLTFAQDSET
ncbi:MAG: hypothetical protein QF535_00505, partial [Anaerolineales bacterium]|nr:hypothetical protein [Anaerolineales bacterium]